MRRFISLVYFVGMVASTAYGAEPVNCDGAPSTSVTRLPREVQHLAVVFCSPRGHALAAPDGLVWIATNGQPFAFSSGSPDGPKPGDTQHSVYFAAAATRELVSESLEKSRQMFKVEFGFEPPDGVAVRQLDLLSSAGFRYNLFFYVIGDRLDRVIGCIDSCQTSVGLRSRKLQAAR